MAKQLIFEYEGIEYTLEYTRKAIENMENSGFNIEMIQNKPMTTLPALFAGAFFAHHRFTKIEKINEIYENMSNKTDLIGKLIDMYNEPIMSLLGDDESEGNVSWVTSW